MAHGSEPKYSRTHLMCRMRAPHSRARPARENPYACNYGAVGAALFDIVNVQIWTRRRARHTRKVASTPGSGAASSLSISPSSLLIGQSARLVSERREVQVLQPAPLSIQSHHCTRGETADAAASERPPQGMEVQVLPGAPTSSLRQAAKASVLHTDTPRFEH